MTQTRTFAAIALDFDRFRVRLDLDVYNLFNSSWPYTVNSVCSTAATAVWRRPTNVRQSCFLKLGGQFSFRTPCAPPRECAGGQARADPSTRLASDGRTRLQGLHRTHHGSR
jgi:hypothetical protein